MQPQVVPQAEHAHGSTVIQQMGLDTELGVQRLLLLLMVKVDPENKGFNITLSDINNALKTVVVDAKPDILIYGHNDKVFLKMVDAKEKALFMASEEERNKHFKTAQ